MPHVVFVPLTGFRVREKQMRELGMTLPGLQQRTKAIAELPALGLLTLAGMLPDSWTCSYRGTQSADDEFINQVLAERPDLVAVSALTASVEEAYPFSEKVRAAGVPVVIGGLHATVCAEEASQFCDAVVVGEGESVWQKLLADVEANRLRSFYQTDRGRVEPHWTLPRFDLLGSSPPRFTLQTQRGCPLACDFCGASRLLGRFQEKPVEKIQRELDVITGITPNPLIELADDNTFAGQRDVEPFFNAFQESRARWFTEADWRTGERSEVLSRLAESGCVQILVGIESLVFLYPGFGQKQAELDRIMSSVNAIQEAGVVVNGCFIVGADGETRESLDRLVQFILKSPLAEVQVTLQTPFPGTGLYQRLQDEDRLLPERGWPYYTLFDVTYQPDRMSVAELEAGFRDVLRQVYSSEATRQRQRIRHEIWHRNARLRGSA